MNTNRILAITALTMFATIAIHGRALAQEDSRAPAAFDFNYQFQPQPGNRHWERTPDRLTFTETYPDGLVTTFPIEGTMDIAGDHGTIVGNETFEVYIPDIGSQMMWVRFRHDRGEWQWLGQMQNVYAGGSAPTR